MENPKFTKQKARKVIAPTKETFDVKPEIGQAFVASLYSITTSLSHCTIAGPNNIVEGKSVELTLTASNGWYLPSSITVVNATYEYNAANGKIALSNPTNNVSITVVCDASVSVNITGGTSSGDDRIAVGGNASVTLVASEGYMLPDSIAVTGATYSYNSTTGVVNLSSPTGMVSIVAVCFAVDAVLENNSWETIRKICEAGKASSIWAVGDAKNVLGGDTYTRPLTIVDMNGLFGKHVVFQFRLLSENTFVWQSTAIESVYNNYSASEMNTVHLVAGGDAYTAVVSSDLGAQLTNTTFKVATNGNDGTLLDVTNKLFLPAEKEVSTSRVYSVEAEFNALTTFQYYVTHNTDADRILNQPSTSSGTYWWLRSPRSGRTGNVCFVYSDGSLVDGDESGSNRVAPCIAF